jgi:Transposase, Mutator family
VSRGGTCRMNAGADSWQRILNAELDEHLDGERVEGSANRRNGHSKKSVVTGTSKRTLSIPRDRAGTFDPKLIAKYQRRFPDLDDKIISMYARGKSVREIHGHLEGKARYFAIPATTIYNRYHRWSQRGLWQHLFERIAASGDVPGELSLDSSHVKAHRSESRHDTRRFLPPGLRAVRQGPRSLVALCCRSAAMIDMAITGIKSRGPTNGGDVAHCFREERPDIPQLTPWQPGQSDNLGNPLAHASIAGRPRGPR